MATPIKFGTSGWRAVIADDFTMANVARAVTGIARYVISEKPEGARLLVGRDPRFLGETLVARAADILSAHGITPLVIPEPAPTPVIAYEVIRTKTDGAINFTASHNPPQYNGIKFSTPDGAPALPEVTSKIEAEIAHLDSRETPVSTPLSFIPPPSSGYTGSSRPEPQSVEVRAPYVARLKEIVDFVVIKKSGLRVAFDPLWGCARGYSDALLRDNGVEVATVHDYRDVLFGGHAPEPDSELLDELRAAMRKERARIGIATDGDADRFGIVDEDGWFVQPNYIIALLFDYLVETRGWKNGVAKSVVTTNLVNALAKHYGIELHETPVGFKYIGELIKQDRIVIGGEESAGLSIRHHVPEKDGILAGLLCCEMVSRRGRSIRAQLHDLFAKVGSFYPLRENFRLTPEVKAKFTTKLEQKPREFFGRKVDQIVRTDGLKLVFGDGAWVCYRLSGTEPVVRVYSEARSEEDLKKLSAAAEQWIFE
ncbi:MAG: phosphoglucomutase/phosphomannomutase family protein [Terriglobales bacterium]